MGVYIYSVRTKSANVEVEGQAQTVYALNYLTRSSMDWDGECRHNKMLMGRAESTWARRGVEDMTGTLVYLAGDDDKPREGNLVIRYNSSEPCCYDTESFGESLGFLRKGRKGRKVVWTVVPAVWTVKFTKPGKANHYVSSKMFFSAGEAVNYARTVPAGCFAKVEVNRVATTRHDRIAAPDTEDPNVTKIETILLSGPWPTSMWDRAGLGSTADYLVSEGRVCFYRDTEEAGAELNYRLVAWVNLVTKAAERFGAPGAAVDLDTEDGKVVCTVATVGRFVGRNCYDVSCSMDLAARRGRKFNLGFNLTLASDNPRLYARVESDRVVFTGGKYGDHALNLSTRSDHEILVHWAGYCDNNGASAV